MGTSVVEVVDINSDEEIEFPTANEHHSASLNVYGGDDATLYLDVGSTTFILNSIGVKKFTVYTDFIIILKADEVDDGMEDNQRDWTILVSNGEEELCVVRNAGENLVNLRGKNSEVSINLDGEIVPTNLCNQILSEMKKFATKIEEFKNYTFQPKGVYYSYDTTKLEFLF
jgi:hypothetical protein